VGGAFAHHGDCWLGSAWSSRVGPQHCLEARDSSAPVRTVPVALMAAVVIHSVAISIENADDWPVHVWMRCTASSIAWMAVVLMR